MASLVLGTVGAVAGFIATGGNPMGAQIGFALGSAAGGILFPPKGPDGPRLNDRSVHASAYGQGIPICYGTVRLAGNVIWADKIQEHASEQGGKGGPTYTTYSYTCSFAVSICEGPIAGVTRIWADGLLIYDKRPTNNGEQVGFKAGAYKLYLGDEAQLPDPTIQAIQGDTPAYRGQAYMVFTDLQLEKFGNRLPSLSFEVVHQATRTFEPPVLWGTAIMMAQDPVTGYLYATEGEQVKVYDPKTRTQIAAIDLPGNFISSPSPHGIVYSNGQFLVGSSSPAIYGTLGWSINPVTNTAEAVGGYSSPYFWPGVPSREGVFFGTNGLAGGQSFDTTIGSHGPAIPTMASNVMVSPDGTSEVFLSYDEPTLCIDMFRDSTGHYLFRTGATNLDWSKPIADNHRIAFNDTLHVLYWGMRGQPGIYEVDRNNGVTRLVIPDIDPVLVLFDPEANLLYVQPSLGDKAVTAYSPTAVGYFTQVEVFPGAGIPTSLNYSSSIYLGGGEWAFSTGTSGDGALYSIKFSNTLAGGPAVLSDIIANISLRVDLDGSDIEVSELTDLVDGYSITHQMAGRSAVEALMPAYFFDVAESDWRVKFPKRGRPVSVVIPDDDLAAHASGSEVPDLVQVKRKQELDLPQIVNVKYINPDADYQTSTQYERRSTGRSNSAVTVDIPVVMSDEKAKQVAAAALYSAWAERTGLTFATSLQYAALEPTDMAIVHNRLVRIVHRKRNGGILEWEAYADGNTIYSSDAINQGGTAAPAGPVGQVITATPLTQLIAIDAPITQEGTTGPVLTFAAQGQGPGWTGAQIFKSIDGGLSYQPIASAPSASLIGTAQGVLGAYQGGDTFDELNTVTVKLLPSSSGATLSSATELAVLNGANAALLGDEVIQYKRAVLNDDGSYTLSGLLRYRRGTDYATHAAGERFVPLTSSLVQIPVSTSEIGVPRQYKAVTAGGTLSSAQPVILTYMGADLKPYSPVHIGGWRNAAGDLTLTWVRRTRIDGGWRDGVDVALGEASEAYDIEILNGSTVVRTLSGVTSPTVTYTAAEQIADFGSVQSSITARAYQLSSAIGRGWPGTGTV